MVLQYIFSLKAVLNQQTARAFINFPLMTGHLGTHIDDVINWMVYNQEPL